jgi:hypothetical protein
LPRSVYGCPKRRIKILLIGRSEVGRTQKTAGHVLHKPAVAVVDHIAKHVLEGGVAGINRLNRPAFISKLPVNSYVCLNSTSKEIIEGNVIGRHNTNVAKLGRSSRV